jgi:predicted Zn-dependent peptidase
MLAPFDTIKSRRNIVPVTPRLMATAAIVVFCSLGTAPSLRQPASAKEVTVSPLRLMSDVKQGVLQNGVRYIIRSTDIQAGPTRVTLLVKAGSNFDQPFGSDIAHILEHLAFLGTQSDPRGGIQTIYRNAGAPGGYGGSTSPDNTQYYVDLVPAVALTPDSALGLLRGIASDLTPSDAEVEAQKGAVIGERRGGDPSVEMANLVDAALDPKDGRRSMLASDIIPSVTRDDVVGHYHRWYTPDRFVVIVSGTGDPDLWVNVITNQFGDIPKRTATNSPSRLPYKPIKSSIKIIPGNSGQKVSLNLMTFSKPPVGVFPDIKIELFNILMSRRASKLNLVRSRQVEHLLIAWRDRQYGVLGNESGLHARVELRDGIDMAAAEDAMLALFTSIYARAFDEPEMAYARAELASRQPAMTSENNGQISNSIVASVMSGISPVDVHSRFDAATDMINSLSAANMTSFARRLLALDDPEVIVASPAAGSSQPFSGAKFRRKLKQAARITSGAIPETDVQISSVTTGIVEEASGQREISTDQFGRRHVILRNGMPVVLMSSSAPQVQIAAVRRSVFYDGAADIGALARSPRAVSKNLLTYDRKATLRAAAMFNDVQVVPAADRFGARLWISAAPQSARPAFEILNRVFTSDGSAFLLTPDGVFLLDERPLSPLLAAGEEGGSIPAGPAERFFDLNFADPRQFHLVVASPLSDTDILSLLNTYIGNIPIEGSRSLPDVSFKLALKDGPYRADTPGATRSIDQRLFIVTTGKLSRAEQLQAQLATQVLSARLFDLIREKLGGAYFPFANIEIRKKSDSEMLERVLQIGMEIDLSRRTELVNAVRNELRKILVEGVDQREFDTMKRTLQSATKGQIDSLGWDSIAAVEEIQTGRLIAEPGDLALIDSMQNDQGLRATIAKIFRVEDIAMISRPVAN